MSGHEEEVKRQVVEKLTALENIEARMVDLQNELQSMRWDKERQETELIRLLFENGFLAFFKLDRRFLGKWLKQQEPKQRAREQR